MIIIKKDTSKIEFKIFLSFFIIYIFFIHWVGWNEESRIALTEAIVKENKIEIDTYSNFTGDRAIYKGHYYSDKAPGTSFLASFVYLISPNVSKIKNEILISRPHLNTTVYTMYELPGKYLIFRILSIVFLSCLPGALIVVLIYKISIFFVKKPKYRLFLAFSFGLGSLLFPYSTVMFGNILATFFSFFAFFMILNILKKKMNKKYLLLSGLLLGFSIVVSYLTMFIFFGLILPLIVYKLSKKDLLCFILSVATGLSPLLVYNYIIFSDPFHLTMFNSDSKIFSGWNFEKNLISVIHCKLGGGAILFLPYRGIFFYTPFLLFCFVGFYFLYKKDKLLCKSLLFTFFLFLSFNTLYSYWFAGSSFGPRYMVSLIPFLSIPLGIFISNIQNKYFLIVLFFLIFLSSLHNFFGLSTFWEGAIYRYYNKNTKAKINWSVKSFEVPANTIAFLNPIYEHYLPMFFKNGPRSRLLEYFLINEIPDIREFKSIPVEEVKILTLYPLGILVLKIPFLTLPILLLLLTFVWKKEVFRFFIFKKISIGLLLILFIMILFSSRLEFKNIVYDKNWYPVSLSFNQNIKERWMGKQASILFYSPERKKTNLILKIGTFYKPRELLIIINNNFSTRYLISSYNDTVIAQDVLLKKGENVIDLIALSGCDRPALLINASYDYRCLSFVIRNISISSLLNRRDSI